MARSISCWSARAGWRAGAIACPFVPLEVRRKATPLSFERRTPLTLPFFDVEPRFFTRRERPTPFIDSGRATLDFFLAAPFRDGFLDFFTAERFARTFNFDGKWSPFLDSGSLERPPHGGALRSRRLLCDLHKSQPIAPVFAGKCGGNRVKSSISIPTAPARRRSPADYDTCPCSGLQASQKICRNDRLDRQNPMAVFRNWGPFDTTNRLTRPGTRLRSVVPRGLPIAR